MVGLVDLIIYMDKDGDVDGVYLSMWLVKLKLCINIHIDGIYIYSTIN